MDNNTYLQYMISINEFFKISNTNLVHSRINHLTELPIDELKSIIETQPLDVVKFNEIKFKIANIINQNFDLMMSPQNKMASIEQTIMYISQKEQDPNLINVLRNELYTQNDDKDYLAIKNKYEEQQKQLNYSNNLNTNNNFSQEQESILTENINNEQQPIINDSFAQNTNNSQNIEQPQQNNNFQFQPNNQETIPYENPLNQLNNEIANQQADIPVIENGKTLVKTLNPQSERRVMVDVPTPNGFIKIGTMVLFGLSFILTIISLVLLIAS